MSAGLLYPEIKVRIDRLTLQKNQPELFGETGARVLKLRFWFKPKDQQLKPRCGSTVFTSPKRQRGKRCPSLALRGLYRVFRITNIKSATSKRASERSGTSSTQGACNSKDTNTYKRCKSRTGFGSRLAGWRRCGHNHRQTNWNPWRNSRDPPGWTNNGSFRWYTASRPPIPVKRLSRCRRYQDRREGNCPAQPDRAEFPHSVITLGWRFFTIHTAESFQTTALLSTSLSVPVIWAICVNYADNLYCDDSRKFVGCRADEPKSDVKVSGRGK
jgi:hypothetical protein